MKQSIDERFWSKVDKTDTCWIWMAAKDQKGYGIFTIGGRNHKAHRMAYELTHKTSLGKLFACHSCDNPSCVHPEHIFPGTSSDNMRDAAQKGRHGNQKHPERSTIGRFRKPQIGEQNNRAKIKEIDVQDIRKMRILGATPKEIGEKYPMLSISSIYSIINYRTWKLVK